MSVLSAFFTSLMVAWHPPVSGEAVDGQAATTTPVNAEDSADPMVVWQALASDFLPQDAAQVRIEQHIIWRIAPRPGPNRESLNALAPTTTAAPRLVERKMGACVPMSGIAAGRPQNGSRLLLFMHDRRLVAANLEKACSARDFYSGFYVDKPNADGKLCADRDRILARSGARCEITSFRQLVAAS